MGVAQLPFGGAQNKGPFKCELLAEPVPVEGSGSIQSLAVGQDPANPSRLQVYAGTRDGRVLRYAWEEGQPDLLSHSAVQAPVSPREPTGGSPNEGEAGSEPVLRASAQATVGKQAVEALCVLPEVRRVAVLCGGQALLLDMLGLDAAAALALARGACLMARETRVRKDGRASQRGCRLAVATAKKLVLLEIRQLDPRQKPASASGRLLRGRQDTATAGGDPAPRGVAAAVVREWPSLEGIQGLAWLGDSLLVATGNQYVLISVKDSAALHLFSLPSGSPHRPLLKVLPNTMEAVLLAEQVGIVVTPAGQPTGGTLLFRSAPVGLGQSAPYMVAATSAGQLEVYHRSSGACVQSLELPGGAAAPLALAEDEAGQLLVVATLSQLWRLKRVPVEIQVRELLRGRRYEEALQLAEEVQPGEVASARADRVAQAHAQAGLLLLADLRFEDAFSHLEQSSALRPVELFPLFPELTARWRSMVPRKRYWGLHPPLQALSEMLRLGLRSAQAGLLPLPSLEGGGRGGATGEEGQEAQLLSMATHGLARYLERARGRAMGESEREGVDALLLRLYLRLGAAKELEALAQADCRCPLSEVEAAMRASGRFCALALLLEGRGLLEDAIVVWSDLARGRVREGEAPEMEAETVRRRAVQEAARLLRNSMDSTSVLQQAVWMLEVDAEAALGVLTSQRLPPESVLAVLPAERAGVRLRYLRWLVEEQQSGERAHHTLYATALADAAAALAEDQEQLTAGSHGRAAEALGAGGALGGEADGEAAVRERLQAFLGTSDAYDGEAVLAHIEGSQLWREQAILLRRRGDHTAALRVLALQLRDSEAAERYCAELGTPEAYMQLLELYLQPGDGQVPLHAAAVRLLHCHVALLDPLRVLEALSADMSLQEACGSIARMLGERMHRHRQGQIVRQLARASNLSARGERVQERARHVVITEDSTCGACGARIGTKLFGLYPNDVVACYQCLRRTGEHICPVTGQDFRESV